MIFEEWKTDADVVVLPGARICGKDITLGDGCSVWFNAVLRSEERITVGKGTNIQDNVVFHAGEGAPTEVGDYCTIGHSAIIHGCKIGNNTLIGMGSTILNDAVIGDNCLIGANSLVTRGTVVPDNSMVMGAPARVIRPLTEKEIEWNRHECEMYLKIKEYYR